LVHIYERFNRNIIAICVKITDIDSSIFIERPGMKYYSRRYVMFSRKIFASVWKSSFAAFIVACGLIYALTLSIGCGGDPPEKDTETHKGMLVMDSVPSADNVMIHYKSYGEGDRALVFVHCWSCDSKYWDAQIEAFRDKYRVVTLDLAGHGESGMERADWTMQAYGSDVAAVVKKLDLKDVILVGHSMGGPVIIEAAHQMQDRVTAIVGVDVYQDFQQRYPEEDMNAMLAPFETDFTGMTREFTASMFPEDADSSLVAWVTEDMSSAPPEVAIPSIRNVIGYDALPSLKGMKIPIRAISSDKFPTNVKGNKEVAYSFEVVYMPGCGHFLHMEDPHTFNQHLDDIINEFWI
jgi:pimeloyl-ACP methyl ester carboxylesterase